MPKSEPPTIEQFVDKWSKSEASERANKDAFLIELCDVLEVGRPEPATGDPKRDVYVFEAPVSIKREEGDDPVGFMDLYKKESFILEAKQGSTSTGKKIGTARRGTSGRHLAMHEARGQALKYATHVEAPPPFLMVCDIGYCFDVFATFDGTTAYREFPTPQAFRVYFKDFEKNAELLRRIFSDPLGLDPSKQSVKVTRDVAAQLAMLDGLGDKQFRFEMQHVTVNPSQFLGIEIKRWSKEIAELVLWIGYLQWHLKAYGRGERKVPVPEPVLKDYKNIECRDAVLAYDEEELLRDEKGVPVSQWDGETMKKHPVTGEDVPDEKARKPVYRYVNPRKAEWPKADFIVGNPPFIGNWRMRGALGDGYTETLRQIYEEVPESVDFVMYWWDKAAESVRAKKSRRFGLVTTNSLRQKLARRVLDRHMTAKPPLSLVFAIPDHPWVDSADGAAVRIAMTAAALGSTEGLLSEVIGETDNGTDAVSVTLETRRGVIHSNLRIGADVGSAVALDSNQQICTPGVKLHGAGFIIDKDQAASLGLGSIAGIERHIRNYRNGRDITSRPRGVRVIDLFGLGEAELQIRWPTLYQWVHEYVKPERDLNKREVRKRNWWLFGEPNPKWRQMSAGLNRYIATVETSKHRFFVFLDADILPDNMLVNISLDDAYYLGVLSSKIHVTWALAAGGTLEDRPRYNKTRCFEPFPFPVCDDNTKDNIRSLAESLDAHRKNRQAAHSKLTMTDMYNVLEKLRAKEVLTAKDREIHEQGLVSVLKKIHDDLDDAVFDAYGWPNDLTDEQILERLVDLNSERAEEEKRGLVRWLRPAYQMKAVKGAAPEPEQQEIAATKKETKRPSAPPTMPAAQKQPWPKSLPERIVAIRDLITGTKEAWTAEAVARSFVRGQVKSAVPVLESLAAVGVLFEYDSGGVRTWRVHT